MREFRPLEQPATGRGLACLTRRGHEGGMMQRLLLKPGAPGAPCLYTADAKGRWTPTDADELGLSEDLAERIELWLDTLDAAAPDDGADGWRFADEAEREAAIAEMAAITQAIQTELPDADISADSAGFGLLS
jgi:hypothetical protein